MNFIEINWSPGPKQLRQFGIISLFGFGLIGTLVAWQLGNFATPPAGKWIAPLILWGIGLAAFALGLIAPRALKPLYVLLTAVTLPIGLVLSHVLLGIIYYGVFLPTALGMRLFRYDPMKRRLEPDAASYWGKRAPAPEAARYYRQF